MEREDRFIFWMFWLFFLFNRETVFGHFTSCVRPLIGKWEFVIFKTTRGRLHLIKTSRYIAVIYQIFIYFFVQAWSGCNGGGPWWRWSWWTVVAVTVVMGVDDGHNDWCWLMTSEYFGSKSNNE